VPKVSEAHRRARREQIATAALRCFARDGIHGATMDRIIAEAGLSAGALYQYFPSKEALVAEVATTATKGFARIVAAEVGREPIEAPLVAVPRLIDALSAYLTQGVADLSRVALQGWAETQRHPDLALAAQANYTVLGDLMKQWLERWRAAGMVAPDLDSQATASVLVSFLIGMLPQRALAADFDPAAYARAMAALISSGP
jgi:AcrR family transcriptional regulator